MQIKYLIFIWQFSLAAKGKQLIHKGLRVSSKKIKKKLKKYLEKKIGCIFAALLEEKGRLAQLV
jgi:hypothetical protein